MPGWHNTQMLMLWLSITKKGFFASDHVFILKTNTDSCPQRGQKLYACFVDFQKAYDSVCIDGLFYKLTKYGISTKFIDLQRDMYSNPKLCVKLSKGFTKSFPSQAGWNKGVIWVELTPFLLFS